MNFEKGPEKITPNQELLNFLEHSKSFEIKNRQKILNLEYPRIVAFIGSSASGKTHTINSLREFANSNGIQIPPRYITRPTRLNEDTAENQNISKEEFNELTPIFHTFDPDAYGSWKRAQYESENLINWTRKMEGDREEQYGFEKQPYYLKDSLQILSANNDLARQGVLSDRKDAIVIGVYTPDEIRAERIKLRSPDLSPDEINYRLGDSSENILPLSDIVIKNYGEFSDNSEELKKFLTYLKAIRKDYVSKLNERVNK